MFWQRLHRISHRLPIAFSLSALLAVISGFFQAPQPDEGAAAHIFQLSVVAFAAMFLAFLATADWKQPTRAARALVIPGSAIIVAFAALFYLEHYFYVAHYR